MRARINVVKRVRINAAMHPATPPRTPCHAHAAQTPARCWRTGSGTHMSRARAAVLAWRPACALHGAHGGGHRPGTPAPTNPGEWFIRGLAPLYFRDRSYLAESTRLHQNPEVKLLRVSLVVTSGTSCESLIMIAFFLFFLHARTHAHRSHMHVCVGFMLLVCVAVVFLRAGWVVRRLAGCWWQGVR